MIPNRAPFYNIRIHATATGSVCFIEQAMKSPSEEGRNDKRKTKRTSNR
jgi:hypothetical protein